MSNKRVKIERFKDTIGNKRHIQTHPKRTQCKLPFLEATESSPWDPWCEPIRRRLPRLKRLYAKEERLKNYGSSALKHRGRCRVTMDTDGYYVTISSVKAFLNCLKKPLRIAEHSEKLEVRASGRRVWWVSQLVGAADVTSFPVKHVACSGYSGTHHVLSPCNPA